VQSAHGRVSKIFVSHSLPPFTGGVQVRVLDEIFLAGSHFHSVQFDIIASEQSAVSFIGKGGQRLLLLTPGIHALVLTAVFPSHTQSVQGLILALEQACVSISESELQGNPPLVGFIHFLVLVAVFDLSSHSHSDQSLNLPSEQGCVSERSFGSQGLIKQVLVCVARPVLLSHLNSDQSEYLLI
jgi:hypothetical protein